MITANPFKMEDIARLREAPFNLSFKKQAKSGALETILEKHPWTGWTLTDDREIVYIGILFKHPKIKKAGIVLGASSYASRRHVRELFTFCRYYYKKMCDDMKVKEVHAYVEPEFENGRSWARHFGLKFVGYVQKGFNDGKGDTFLLYRWKK